MNSLKRCKNLGAEPSIWYLTRFFFTVALRLYKSKTLPSQSSAFDIKYDSSLCVCHKEMQAWGNRDFWAAKGLDYKHV